MHSRTVTMGMAGRDPLSIAVRGGELRGGGVCDSNGSDGGGGGGGGEMRNREVAQPQLMWGLRIGSAKG